MFKENNDNVNEYENSQKLRRFRNISWFIGRLAGSTQPSRGRVPLSLHSCQNPQFGMTINNIPLLEIKDFGPPARGGHFVLFHSFLPPQPYGTQFHTAHTSPVQLVSLAHPSKSKISILSQVGGL